MHRAMQVVFADPVSALAQVRAGALIALAVTRKQLAGCARCPDHCRKRLSRPPRKPHAQIVKGKDVAREAKIEVK